MIWENEKQDFIYIDIKREREREVFARRPWLEILDGLHRLCVKKEGRIGKEKVGGSSPFKRSLRAAASMSLGFGSYFASGDSRRSGTGRPELEEADGWGLTRN